MTHLTLGNVNSTILANSYYEVLANTKLGTTSIAGETVVTEPNDVFLVKSARITLEELRALLDEKLLDSRGFAARFCALSLALDATTTDAQIHDAMIKYDFHPELVSVAIQMGKTLEVETMKLLKKWKTTNYDWALEEAAAEGRVDAMEILKKWGASRYTWALSKAAAKGQIEAMRLLNFWGVAAYDSAFVNAAGGGHVEAMKLLKDWGAKDYKWALASAKLGGHAEAIDLIETWGSSGLEGPLKLSAV